MEKCFPITPIGTYTNSWHLDQKCILRDLDGGKVVRWDKTMKGISMKGNMDLLSIKSLPLYRNPVIDFCCILQYGSNELYRNLNEVHSMMHILAHHRSTDNGRLLNKQILNVAISFNQSVFKRKLAHVFIDEFIMSIPMMKEARLTQLKRYPRPDNEDAFGITYPIGWR